MNTWMEFNFPHQVSFVSPVVSVTKIVIEGKVVPVPN
jgi:hypothetical protein